MAFVVKSLQRIQKPVSQVYNLPRFVSLTNLAEVGSDIGVTVLHVSSILEVQAKGKSWVVPLGLVLPVHSA